MSKAGIHLSFSGGTLVVQGLRPGDLEDIPENILAADDRIGGAYRAKACDYAALVTALRQAGKQIEDTAKAFAPVKLVLKSPFPPRDYQLKALDDWKFAGYRGVISLPTGSGKSFVGALACAKIGRPALIIAPTIDLMLQWAGTLEKFFGEPAGLLGGGYHEIRNITAATYDSAALHMERLGNRFGLLICDECHHLPGPRYRVAAEEAIAPFRLGLSATPDMEGDNGVILKRLMGNLCSEMKIKELTGRVLSGYRIEHVPLALSPEEQEEYHSARSIYTGFVKRRHIDFRLADGWKKFITACATTGREGREAFSAFIRQRELSRGGEGKYAAIWELISKHINERIIIFTAANAQAYEIGERFSLPVLTHRTGSRERRNMLDHFRSGVFPVLVSSRVLNEGVDVPEANIGIVVSGTSTGREYLQRLGRILRAAPGKQQAVLYELINGDTAEFFVAKRRAANTHKALRG